MIQDSGNRREFETGSVRDARPGVGRCDLMPLMTISHMYDGRQGRILRWINRYIKDGDTSLLYEAIYDFISIAFNDNQEAAILEVAKHFEEGCNKYGERNWEKGIPLHCYIDSGVRHLLKYYKGDTDERHDRAFLWNMMCAIWTHENKPEMIDLPFKAQEEPETKDELLKELRLLHGKQSKIIDRIEELKEKLYNDYA